MLISEMIEKLVAAKRLIGDRDVTFVHGNQYQDVLDVVAHKEAPRELYWCFSGPVAVVKLDVPA